MSPATRSPTRTALRRLAALLLLASLQPGRAVGQPPARAESPARREILVRFADRMPHDVEAWTRANLGAKVVRRYTSVPGLYLFRLRPGAGVAAAVQQARRLPGVRYAETNKRVEPLKIPDDPLFSSMWHLPTIDAPRAWDVTTGSPDVVVAVLDTGVDYDHQDLTSNLLRTIPGCTVCTEDCQLDVLDRDCDPKDVTGHGTQVAGVIGAIGNNQKGVVGIDWRVGLLACRFMGGPNEGDIGGAIACLDRVKKVKDAGTKVVATNNSWRVSEEDVSNDPSMESLRDAIDAQRESGILFVAGAGNGPTKAFWGPEETSPCQDSDLCPVWPAAFFLPNVIAVGSTMDQDQPANDSHFGRATVHLWAPGVAVHTTSKGGGYGTASGTSFAAPQVTGAVALVQTESPELDWKAIKNLLLAGGTDIEDAGPTITGKRLSLLGSLPQTCQNVHVRSRVRPTTKKICAAVGDKTLLAVISINCQQPDGPVSVSVDSPGVSDTVILADDDGDGLYMKEWVPTSAGDYTLTFPNTDLVKAKVCAGACASPCP
jgi:subtilisin family serine protease